MKWIKGISTYYLFHKNCESSFVYLWLSIHKLSWSDKLWIKTNNQLGNKIWKDFDISSLNIHLTSDYAFIISYQFFIFFVSHLLQFKHAIVSKCKILLAVINWIHIKLKLRVVMISHHYCQQCLNTKYFQLASHCYYHKH